MQSDKPSSPTSPPAPASSGRRIRVRSIKRPSFDKEAHKLPSAPSDDNDWVSPFTLPPLPTFKPSRTQSNWNRSPEERLHNRTTSGAYYAAAWGSPYATPSPNSSPAPRGTRNKSFDLKSSSPLVPRSAGPDRAEHSSTRARNFSVPAIDSTSPSAVRSRTDLTEEEVFTANRRNWLSESEGSEGEGTRGFGETPTKLTYASVPRSSQARKPRIPGARSHQLQESVATITPETFNGYSSSQLKGKQAERMSISLDADMADHFPAGQEAESPEKPLPSLPTDGADESFDHAQSRPTMPPQVQSFQRPKKKIPWKGKHCVIALPLTDRESAGLPLPMTAQEIRGRLQDWIDRGFPIHGFSIGDWSSPTSYNGDLSRPTYPDPVDLEAESKTGNPVVRIPNLAEWEAWVEHIKEEKLRALGVTPSNSEAPASTQSPFSAMSRVSSTYPSMAATPPISSASANSNQIHMATSPFSPLSDNQSGFPFSAKPQLPTPQPGTLPSPLHGYRQSIAVPHMQQRMTSPFDYPITQPSNLGPGMRSPPDPMGRRQFSPGHVQNLQSMGNILSPTGFPDNSRHPHSNPHVEQVLRQQEHVARQHQQMQAQIAHHQRQMSMFPMRSVSTEPLPRTPATESPARHTPEIMHPTPRSHRHNLSAALEQGVENSKLQHNNASRQADQSSRNHEAVTTEQVNGDNAAADELAQEDLPILARPETLRDVEERSEIETNPSIAGTPLLLDEVNPFSSLPSLGETPQKTQADGPGHVSRPSGSKLNVQAKEFNPTGAFSSSNFTFGENLFAPAPAFGKPNPPVGFASHKPKAPSLAKFNVEAPEFTPSFLKDSTSKPPAFGESTTKSAVDSTPEKSIFDPRSSTFSFSSATFNVDAPEFRPSGGSKSSFDFTPEKPLDLENSIFGKVVIDPSAKTSRRTNKAVPIVRPQSQDEDSSSHSEPDDENGRPSAPFERQKRARKAGSDGDNAPLFADSAPFTSFADAPKQSPNLLQEDDSSDADEERLLPDGHRATRSDASVADESLLDGPAPVGDLTEPQEMGENADLEETVADVLPSNFNVVAPTLPETSSSPVEETAKDGASNQAKALVEAEAEPLESPLDSNAEPDATTLTEATDLKAALSANAPVFEPSTTALQPVEPVEPSLLSAKAEPFVLKPSATEFKPVPASVPVATTKPKKPQGLMASRFAQASSPEPTPPASPASQNARDVSPNVPMIAAENSVAKPDMPLQTDSFDAEASAPLNGLPGEQLPSTGLTQQHMLLEKYREDVSRSPSYVSMAGDISLEEINAVMQELEDNPDYGIIREDTPIESTPLIDMRLPPNFRSDAPSPSPGRMGAIYEQEPPTSYGGLNLSGVHQLNYGSGNVSDWNNDLSPNQQQKLEARANFFDDHVNDLVDNVLENRLAPLEQTLRDITQSLTVLSTQGKGARRHSRSTGYKDSDADDEDDYDDQAMHRPRSPQRKERRQEQIKSAVLEAFATSRATAQSDQETAVQNALAEMKELMQQPQQSPTTVDMSEINAALAEMRQLAQREPPQPVVDLTSLHNALKDIQDNVSNAPKAEQYTEFRSVLEDVIATHPGLKPQAMLQDDGVNEKFHLKIEELEALLKASEKRAEAEAALRREAEDEADAMSRRLKEVEDAAANDRKACESAQRSLEAFVQEQQDSPQLEPELEELRLKNTALEQTLDEYRKSSDQWREEIREERERTKEFAHALKEVRNQYDDRLESRQVLRSQIERLQHRISQVMEDVHHDEAEWRKREHDLTSKNQLLQSALDHETNRRARIELDADNLHKEHKEGLHFRAKHEYAQQEISRLTTLIATLQNENKSHQDTAYHAQRELAYHKENKDALSASATARLQADLEATSNAFDKQRADSESEAARLRSRLEAAELDLEDQKSKHNKSMSHVVQSHNQSLEEVHQKHDAEVERLQAVHEEKLNELRETHARHETNMLEDRNRLASQLAEKLTLSEDKAKHLEGKVTDLEERLEVTKSAARAAVEAATAKGVNLPTPASSVVASPPHRASITSASMPLARGSDLPEKISPQALRESILVLQDQLQNREQRIEKLEAELAAIDKDAPAKVKERDTEITMLRELLDVRLDDLQELIGALEKPDYDRTTVKDAAIRLKTQMKMEQQLKERIISGIGLSNLPASITSGLVNLTQSPRAMVAAAAWGNWRKVRDTGVSAVSDFASTLSAQTPARPAPGAAAMSGARSPSSDSADTLRSPTIRPLAAAAAARKAAAPPLPSMSSEGARPLRAYSSQPRTLSGARKLSASSHTRTGSSSSTTKAVEPSSMRAEPPSTPLHLQTESDFGDDIDEDASPLDGKDRSFDISAEDSTATVVEPRAEDDKQIVEVIEEE